MSGLNCEGCKEHYPYAAANQPNGKLVCYGCRINGFILEQSKVKTSEEIANWMIQWSNANPNAKVNEFLNNPIIFDSDSKIYQERHIAKTDFIKKLDEDSKLIVREIICK